MLNFQDTSKAKSTIVMKTNHGDIKIMLFPEAAPKAVENFMTHAKTAIMTD